MSLRTVLGACAVLVLAACSSAPSGLRSSRDGGATDAASSADAASQGAAWSTSPYVYSTAPTQSAILPLPSLYPTVIDATSSPTLVVGANDYRAKCDGATDDTVALNQALLIAANDKAQLLIPTDRTCVISDTLNLQTGTQLVLDGTLLAGDLSAPMMATSSTIANSDIVVTGTGTLDGNASVPGVTPEHNVNESGISFGNFMTTNIWIDGITIQHHYNWGVNIGLVTNAYLSNLVLTNNGASNEFVLGTNCWADHLTVSNSSTDGCFTFYGGVQTGGITNSSLSHCTAGIGVFSDGAQSGPSNDILIANNRVFDNRDDGIGVVGEQTNTTIVGNTVFANGALAGGEIYIDPSASHVLVEGNSVSGGGQVVFTEVTNGALTPTIETAQSPAGVYVAGVDVAIVGNTILDEGQGSNTGIGVVLAGPAFVQIQGNQIGTDDSPTMPYAFSGTSNGSSQYIPNTIGASLSTNLNGGGSVALGANGDVWGLDRTGSIFRFVNDAPRPYAGKLLQLAVGADGDVWGLSPAGQIYRLETGAFSLVQGTLAQIAVGSADNVWGVSSSGQVYRLVNGAFAPVRVPEALSQVSAASDGTVLAVSPSGDIFQYTNGAFVQLSGSLEQVSVGSASNVWGLNEMGVPYQLVGGVFVEGQGALAAISAAADGSVWGKDLNDDGVVQFVQGAFAAVPAAQQLAQVVVGNASTVWGINASATLYRYDGQSGLAAIADDF